MRAESSGSSAATRAHTVFSEIETTLFWVAFISFAYFYQGADQSTAARFDLMRSLVERRTLWIDGYCGYNTADIIWRLGHYYSVKAPGGALTGLIQWLILSVLFSPLTPKYDALYWALTTWLTIVLSTSVLVSLGSVVIYRLVLLLGASTGRAVMCALIMPFATIMFPYATEMTGEPIAGICSLLSFYLLASQTAEHDSESVMWAGALAGWAVLCDFPAILIAVPIALYALWQLGVGRALVAFSIGATTIALVLFAYNWRAFDNPFFLSYEAYKDAANTQFPEQAAGFVGLTYPRIELLYKIIVDPQRGLFFCNPVLLLSAVGLVGMWQRRLYRVEVLVIGFAALAMILFNASFGRSIVSWGGGTATGPRQIVAAIPFMVIPLAFLPAAWNWLLVVLGTLSASFMLMATAVEPHFPYEYTNPIIRFVLPAFLRADLAYNRDGYFGGPAVVDQSTAFNLGKLVGLWGPLQLLPLAALWIWAASRLMHAPAFTVKRVAWRAGAYSLIAGVFIAPLVGRLVTLTKPSPIHGLLGSYYRALEPDGFGPHIERVDPQLEFGNVAALGALPAPSRVVWTGTLTVPRPGLYRFIIEADDSGWLTIDAKSVIRDPGNVIKGNGTGAIFLAAGPHRIEAGERNLGGDASMRLLWQPPRTSAFELMPSAALTPR